jgi:predicted nucleic acid-binding protein
LVGAKPTTEPATRRFLERFELIDLDDTIAEKSVILRRAHRLKLPDAVIWASAQVRGRLLITRNTKDYPKNDPGIRMPYVL